MFDFKKNRVTVNAYMIKTHRFSVNSCHLKSWKLQNSNNGKEWADLDARDTDVLNGASKEETFTCSARGAASRYVRLLQVGRNIRGDHLLALTNIEFFGRIEPESS
jgi:hypothetical protein